LSSRNADPGAEQEVDLGRHWSAIVARWWLPVLGLIAGAFVGYVISLGGKEVWKASSTVYLGAPYSSVGGVFLQGPQSNPSTAGTIARSESSRRATSASTTVQSPPARSISPWSDSASAICRSASTRRAPSRANRSAQARPIPVLAPVMTAVFPASRIK